MISKKAEKGSVYDDNICFLLASDAKSRQHWVNMIRAVGEFHSLSPAHQEKLDHAPTSLQRSASLGAAFLHKGAGLKRSTTVGAPGVFKPPRPQSPKLVVNPADSELSNVKNALNTVDEYHATVVETLEVCIRHFH